MQRKHRGARPNSLLLNRVPVVLSLIPPYEVPPPQPAPPVEHEWKGPSYSLVFLQLIQNRPSVPWRSFLRLDCHSHFGNRSAWKRRYLPVRPRHLRTNVLSTSARFVSRFVLFFCKVPVPVQLRADVAASGRAQRLLVATGLSHRSTILPLACSIIFDHGDPVV